MERIFIPYRGDKCATITVNGHSLLLASQDPGEIEEYLDLFNGDRVFPVDDGRVGQEVSGLSPQGGLDLVKLVVKPPGIDFADLVKVLESSLPWVQ